MGMTKLLITTAAIVSLTATPTIANTVTRSATALPSSAPLHQVRAITSTRKHGSKQFEWIFANPLNTMVVVFPPLVLLPSFLSQIAGDNLKKVLNLPSPITGYP